MSHLAGVELRDAVAVVARDLVGVHQPALTALAIQFIASMMPWDSYCVIRLPLSSSIQFAKLKGWYR